MSDIFFVVGADNSDMRRPFVLCRPSSIVVLDTLSRGNLGKGPKSA